jgi:hypothetical protein
MALLSVIALGTGLVSVCLPEDPHQPAYYDGDGDDVGIAQERQTLVSTIAIVRTAVRLAPLLPSDREVAQSSKLGAQVQMPPSPRIPRSARIVSVNVLVPRAGGRRQGVAAGCLDSGIFTCGA